MVIAGRIMYGVSGQCPVSVVIAGRIMYGVFSLCPVSVVIAGRIMYVGVLSVWSSPVGLCMECSVSVQ